MRVLRHLLFVVAALLGATAAHAQIAFRDSAKAGVASTAGTAISHVGVGAIATTDAGCPRNVAPAVPAGVAGDLLITVVNEREESATVSASAGWTLLTSSSFAGQDLQGLVYYRFATGADALTVTASGTCGSLSARMSRFRGVDAVEPFISVPLPGAAASQQNAATLASGTETTVAPNAMLVVAAFINDDDTITAAAGWSTSHANALNVGQDLAYGLYYQLQTTAGAKNITGWVMSASDRSIGIIFSLRPANGLSIARPPATATGDVMVASVVTAPSTLDIAAPPGWVLVRNTAQAAGNTTRMETYYKVVSDVSSEPASYTFTFNGASTGASGGIVSFSGVDTVTPVDVEGGAATASSLTHTAASLTTTFANTMLVGSFEFASSPSAANWSPSAGMTEAVDQTSIGSPSNNGVALQMAYQVRAAIGATGTRAATASGVTADTGVAHLLALKPISTVKFDVVSGDYVVACAATPIAVTITVRDPVSNAIVTGYTGLVNLSTSSGTGDWSRTVPNANGTVVNGAANDGDATYQFVVADGGIARLDLAVPAATTLTVTVQDATTGFFTTGSTTLNYVADGYVVIPASTPQVAGKTLSFTVEHRVSPACTLSTANGHGASNAVKVWLGLDPSHPVGAALPTATGTGGAVALTATEPGANNINLDFSGPGALVAGQAPMVLTPTDVGKYVVYVRDTNTVRRGSSSPVTMRPFALAFTSAGAFHGTTAASAVFGTAGSAFSLTLGAYLWAAGDDAGADGLPDANVNITNNGLTPAFKWDVVVARTLNLPGTALGTIARGGSCASAATAASGEFSGGAAAIADWCYTEAGNVFLTAAVTNYLNSPGVNITGDSGMDGTGAAGGYVGRFRPSQFALSAVTLTNRSAASCGVPSTFSYMNETLGLAFTLTAQNAQGTTTQNYTGTYAKLGLTTFANYGLGARSGTTNLTTRLDSGVAPTGTWSNGVANVSMTTGIQRATPDAPDGPYASLGFGIAPVESDSVPMSTLDFDADNNAINERKSLGVTTEARFGRLRVSGATGSEKFALAIPIETQYWSGSGFVTNTSDSCTVIDRSNIALTFSGAALTACETAVSAATVPFASGVGTLKLAAPGAGNTGNVIVTPNLGTTFSGSYCPSVGGSFTALTSGATRSYLLGRWDDASNPDASASTDYDDNPAVRAAFGVYGAKPNNAIFQRENY